MLHVGKQRRAKLVNLANLFLRFLCAKLLDPLTALPCSPIFTTDFFFPRPSRQHSSPSGGRERFCLSMNAFLRYSIEEVKQLAAAVQRRPFSKEGDWLSVLKRSWMSTCSIHDNVRSNYRIPFTMLQRKRSSCDFELLKWNTTPTRRERAGEAERMVTIGGYYLTRRAETNRTGKQRDTERKGERREQRGIPLSMKGLNKLDR